MRDYFISYNRADRAIAIAIRAWIEDRGHTVVMQAGDFGAGSNFVLEMDSALKAAKRTIAVLSPDYLTAPFPQSEWAAAFAKDPVGEQRSLIPVRVRECKPEGLLGQIVYVDLVGLDMAQMEAALFDALDQRPGSGARPASPKVPKKRSVRAKAAQETSIIMTAEGQNNYQAGRDLVMTQKHVIRAGPIVPQEVHISDGQAKKILDLLKKLGERDEKAGKGKTYGLWQDKFKKRPWAGSDAEGITSYKLLPLVEFDDAIQWISEQKAQGRPGLRRTQNDEWKKDHYNKIWGCAKKLGWDHDQVHRFAQEYLDLKKPVASLRDLGEQNLSKVSGAIYRRAKK